MCHCDDAEPYQFFDTTNPVARKLHKCSECRRAIARGERYVCHTGKWDGEIGVFRLCAHCDAASQAVINMGVCDCVCLGNLWGGVRDEMEETGDGRALRLIVAARRKWTVKRGKRAGQLMPVPKPVAQPAIVEAR